MNLNPFNLPDDAVEFLSAGRQFEYDHRRVEPGEVRLKRVDELVEGEIWLGPELPGDPHAGETGYYAIPAVSLTGGCNAYDPEFILLWLPSEKVFGTWDPDHLVLKVFRAVSWSEIVASPGAYLNAQWNAADRHGTPFVPWPEYEFRSGKPF